MSLRLLGGNGNPVLLDAIAHALGIAPEERVLERFPDGELHVVLERSQHAAHVAIVQATGPPVDEHLVELVMLADASRRAGAARVTAAVPYFGYSRQDHRSAVGEAIGAKAIAKVIESAGVDQIVIVDPHSAALETMFDIVVHTLSAVPTLATALHSFAGDDAVLVAPDLGAVKLAERYAALLHLPVAVVRKTRLTGEKVHAIGLVGDVRDRRPLIVDDMITTAGTVEAAAHVLLDHGCRAELVVAATHGLFVVPAESRLAALPLQRVLVTDTTPVPVTNLPCSVIGVGGVLADALTAMAP